MSSHGRALVDNGFWKTRIRVAFEASRPKPPPVEAAVQARPPKKQRRDAAVQTDPLPARVDVGVQTDPPPAYLSLGSQTAPPPPSAAAGVQTDLREGHSEAGVDARPVYVVSGAQARPRYVSSEVQAEPLGYASSEVQAGADESLSLMAVDGHAGEDDMLISPGSSASPLPDWKELHAPTTSAAATPMRVSPPPPSGPPPPPPPPPVEQKPSRWDIERSASASRSTARSTPAASTPVAPPTVLASAQPTTSDAKGPYSFAGFIPASARAKYKLARPTDHTPESSSKYEGLVEMWTVQQLDFPLTHPPPSHAVFQQTLRAQLAGKDLDTALAAARRWFWAREKRPRLVAWHDKKEAALAWERTQALAEADFRSSSSPSSSSLPAKERPQLSELPKLSLAAAAKTLALRPAFARDGSVEARVLSRLEEGERRLVAYGEAFDECRMLDGLRGGEYVKARRALHVRAWGVLRMPGYAFGEMKEWAPERMDVELALWRSMRRTPAPLGGSASPSDAAKEPPMDVVFFAPASLDADAPKRAGYPPPNSDAYGRMVEQWTWDLLVRSTRNKDDGALQPLAPSDALATIEKLQDADLETACGVLAAFVAAQIAPPHARADALALRPTLDAKRSTRAARVLAETARERLAGFVPPSFPQAQADGEDDEGADLSAFFVPRDVPRARYKRAVELWALLQDAILPAGTDVRRWLARMLDADDAAVARAALDVARAERYDGARSWAETKAAHEKREAERAEKARREAEEMARKEAEEKARKEAEETARRDAEEKARKENEEKARKDAELERREAEALAEKARREQERQEQEQARAAPVTKVPGFVPAAAPAKPSFAPIALKPVAASRATTAVASLSPTTPHKTTTTPRPPSPTKAPPPLPRKPATAVPGFVAASAPDGGGSVMRMGDRSGTFVPRGESAPLGPEYERALEDWVLDHIAREMLRMPDGGVPWPVELDTLVGYDRDVARRVWEEKCVMEGQPVGQQAGANKRRRRTGRRVRRQSSASAGRSHYSPSPWNDNWEMHDRRASGSWDGPPDRRASGSWEDPPDRRASGGWDDHAAIASGWDDPMAVLERRSGWTAPYDAPPPPPLQPPPPPPPPPGREWERQGDVAWMPPAQVTPYDYAEQVGTKRKRSASASSADSQFSYSQPVMSAVHTRVPLPHVHKRSQSRSPARERRERRHSRSLSPHDHRARRRQSRIASDAASHGHGPGPAAENSYRPGDYWGRARSPSPGPVGHYVPNDPRADHWEPSPEPARADHWEPSNESARADTWVPSPPRAQGPGLGRGCYVCGEWGHEASRCPNRDRAPHLVLTPAGRLTLPDGRTTVCWVWNSGAPCRVRRRKSKGGAGAPCGHAHACSLCGSTQHPACNCVQFQHRR